MPFSDHPEAADLWNKCVIRISSEDSIAETESLLRDHLNNRIKIQGDEDDVDDMESNGGGGGGGGGQRWLNRRKNCRLLHERFFSSHDEILDAAFASINLRIKQSVNPKVVFSFQFFFEHM
jgi:hypothetical protein